ncbi:MAG: hypothetical protein B6I38_00525, partial [Anaerolineaceae bacterium 4572_5.1]
MDKQILWIRKTFLNAKRVGWYFLGILLVLNVINAFSVQVDAESPPLDFFLIWSSIETGVKEVVWVDIDNDGYLDLVVNKSDRDEILIYHNEDGLLNNPIIWKPTGNLSVDDMAWGDIDNDGDLDLAVETWNIRVFLNEQGVISPDPYWSCPENGNDNTTSLVWGDVNGDGYLDLAIGNWGQKNYIYLNNNGVLSQQADWSSTILDNTTSLAWGDVDSDGYLDLAVGNWGQKNYIYRNYNGTLSQQVNWSSITLDNTTSLVWGDVDSDGYLDLAVGNGEESANQLYHNNNGSLDRNVAWVDLNQNATHDIALGDIDGDGDIDLLAGDSGDTTPLLNLYLNEDGIFSQTADWSANYNGETSKVALGDIDNDGDLDIGVSYEELYGDQKIQLYRNDSTTLSRKAIQNFNVTGGTGHLHWGDFDGDSDIDLITSGGFRSLHRNEQGTLVNVIQWVRGGGTWGDVDRDGDLDLVTGNKLYQNDNGELSDTPIWTLEDGSVIFTEGWGDVDGDGDLDLAAGNNGQPNCLFFNTDGTLQNFVSCNGISNISDNVANVAWGDVDGDGDLDLAAGNNGQPNRVYFNIDGTLEAIPSWSSSQAYRTRSIAWGDIDGDGDLDLAVGNFNQADHIYINRNGILSSDPIWFSENWSATRSVAWGDVDGDGDLDLAVGNYNQPNYLYRNENGTLTTKPVWVTEEWDSTTSIAWGDIDNDGDIDIAVGNDMDFSRIYKNYHGANEKQPIKIYIMSNQADFYSTAIILDEEIIPITYTFANSNSVPVQQIIGQYSLNGGGQWMPAVAAAGAITQNLNTSPQGETHVFFWDVAQSGFMGRSDNVVFRLTAIPGIVNQPNQTPGPYMYGAFSASTFPFRVRGTQIRVLSGTMPISNAIVYRLPAGHSGGGEPIADAAGNPFRTDGQGYLQGRGEIHTGDQLLALAPLDWTQSITWAEGLTATMRLYRSSGVPTETGLDSFMVTEPGVQELSVSPTRTLLLFDLYASLEWDAHQDPAYLLNLETNLKRTGEYLYDFTNGQVSLGNIIVSQDADDWGTSHIVIHADNHLRPYAAIGGIVEKLTPDPDDNDILYDIGQIHIGATWSRYNTPGQGIEEDWPLILAHELAHYLFFLDDTYLGLNEDDLLIALDSCTGSAMGDVYANDNTEFIADDVHWGAVCSDTLGNERHRDEWETLTRWYPWLTSPPPGNEGPGQIPFELTSVTILSPITPTNALENDVFYPDYANGEYRSAEARAFLLKEDRKYIIALGMPIGQQGLVKARGAEPGDRLCVFDPGRHQYGCEIIQAGDERLALEKDTSWTPLIQISPVTSLTFGINVSNLPANLPLKAKLYPEYGEGGEAIDLLANGASYSGTINLSDSALTGRLQVWVDEEYAEENPRRETIVEFAIGGNPGNHRSGGGGNHRSGGGGNHRSGGGGNHRSGGGGNHRSGGGGVMRAGQAPVVSPDGQMIFFVTADLNFPEGEFFTVQNMAGLPALPEGKTALGQAYNLFATPNAPELIGSISFQYLEGDADVADVDEDQLTIHFWDGSAWRALNSHRDSKYNLVSASSRGPGIYALLGGVTAPIITAISPSSATNDISQTLVISGGYFLPPVAVTLIDVSGACTYSLPV